VVFAVMAIEEPDPPARVRATLFGGWNVVYSTALPPLSTVIAAIGLAFLLAAGVAIVEHRITNRLRRSLDPERNPLSPRPVMDRTQGVFSGPVTITALVPAHNEETTIAHTLASLRTQHRPPERVIVVADNCTDRTAAIARREGAEIYHSVHNKEKKGGALNQVLAILLTSMGPNDAVMVIDADTTIDPLFLHEADQRMTADRALMAVGGLFAGGEGGGLLGQYQRNEFTRYRREITRRRGRPFVLTGTATVFRSEAMRTVAMERGRSLPGIRGYVYDTSALTEDNEITLALKSLGATMTSPPECTVTTEIMPTWHMLFKQRLRWQRGALENLGAYGMRRAVLRYWAQQLGIGYAVLAIVAYFAVIAIQFFATETWIWFPWWVVVGGIFALERVITAWSGGARARWLAALLFPELAYAVVLHVVFVTGVVDIVFGRRANWSHLDRSAKEAALR